jgi:hypothetical protein
MKQWHMEHMQKTVVTYVKGVSENASAWEKRNHKKYYGLTRVCKQIEYDIKHGVSEEEVRSMLHKVRHHSSFSKVHESGESMARLEEIGVYFKESGSLRGVL